MNRNQFMLRCRGRGHLHAFAHGKPHVLDAHTPETWQITARLDCRCEIRRAVPNSARHRSQVSTVPSDRRLSGVEYSAATWIDGLGGPTAGGKQWAGVGGIAPEGFAAWPVAGLAQNPKNISLDIRHTWHRLLIGGRRKAEG